MDLEIVDGELTIDIEINEETVDVTIPDTDAEVLLVTVPGERGADGFTGGFTGVAWFYGNGAPTPSPIGSKEGDFYLDTDDGTIYRLGE